MIEIKRDKVVLNLGETHREKSEAWTGCYSHFAGDKIFYRLDKPAEICYAVKHNDEYVKPLNNSVLSNSLAIQNFRVFVDTNPDIPENEKYKAIGGYHANKTHSHLQGCEVSKNATTLRAQNPVWPQEERYIMADNFSHPRHANGFYIFKSKDGEKWELYHNKPVLSAFTLCEESILGSDTMPSIFYDYNIDEYVVYLRCNVRLGVRHVFYTKSKDLINWDTPKLITKSPSFDFEHGNLYYMGAYPFPDSDKYISFTHYFKNYILTPDGSRRKYADKKTLVMVSDNGTHWNVVGDIFSQDPESVRESGRQGCIKSMATHLGPPHVIGFEKDADTYVVYALEGIQTTQTRIVKYTIDQHELDAIVFNN